MYAPGRHQDTPHPYGQMRATGLPTATPYTPATLASIKEYESVSTHVYLAIVSRLALTI
jgi:hypothetical protein